jgi:hypothetical protein
VKVFLSWSGERSKRFASELRDWLPNVIQVIQPWMSSEDVEKGAPWFQQIGDGLAQSEGLGVFCVTPENTHSPWLNFEAGYLAAGGRARVCIAVLGLEPAELPSPLSLFQATKVEKQDFRRLIGNLNQQTERPLSDSVLERSFETFWPSLESALHAVATQKVDAPKQKKRTTDELLHELIESNRRIERQVAVLRYQDGLVVEAYNQATKGAPGLNDRSVQMLSAIPLNESNAGSRMMSLRELLNVHEHGRARARMQGTEPDGGEDSPA